MSKIRTIASLPEDLHKLCISDLGYASEVHDESDDIRAQLQAAFAAGKISGLDADDLDKLTIKDALRLTVAIGQQDDNEDLSLPDFGGAGLRSLRSTPVSKLDLADYVSAVKEMRYLHDELDEKGRDWLRMTSTVPGDKRQSSSGYQDHLQAIMKKAIEWKPTEGTEGADLLRVQLRQRQGIQRVYSEALLRSALQSSLPSFIVSVKTEVESRLKTKKTKKTKKGLGESAMNELDTISQVIKDIADQTLAPSSKVIESCKEALTKYPLKEDGDDLFFRLISEDGKRHTKLADDCTLADASVYSLALKRYARERHDKVVEEQDPILKTIIPLWKDAYSTYADLFSEKGMEKLSTHANAYKSTWEPTLDGAKGHVLMEEARQQALFRKDAISAFKALSKTDLSLYSNTADKLGIQMEMIDDAWTRFKNDVDIGSQASYQRMDVSKAVFDRSEKPKGVEWLEALRESGDMDADWFEGYFEAAHDALEAYKENTITLEELDTKLELPEAPVRPDVSHLDPECSYNSHSEYRRSLPVEDRFVEVNDCQIGGYANSSKTNTAVGTGTTSHLTHRSKTSSRTANTATAGSNRKKTKRKPFTAGELVARVEQEERDAQEKAASTLSYAQALKKPAPSAATLASSAEDGQSTEAVQSVQSG